MLSPGFLGTRADWLMDVVIVSLVVILPAIAYSWQRARQHDWDQHKKVQVWLTIILTIVVSLFELDLKLAGGMEVLTRESAYFGTPLLNWSTYIHLFFSVTTSIIWLVLIVVSLRRFDKPPVPNAFSKAHRFWGKIGMIWMAMTGLTGLVLYVVGFAL